jgi:hypothetical protein
LPVTELENLQQQLADDAAMAAIQSSSGRLEDGWFHVMPTTSTRRAVRYLQLRNLIEVHAERTNWIRRHAQPVYNGGW